MALEGNRMTQLDLRVMLVGPMLMERRSASLWGHECFAMHLHVVKDGLSAADYFCLREIN